MTGKNLILKTLGNYFWAGDMKMKMPVVRKLLGLRQKQKNLSNRSLQ